MKRALVLLALASVARAHALADAPQPKKLTVAFTGDNGGEIAPCG